MDTHVFRCPTHGIKLTVTVGPDGYESRHLEKDATQATAGCVLADFVGIDELREFAARGETGRRKFQVSGHTHTVSPERIEYLGNGQ